MSSTARDADAGRRATAGLARNLEALFWTGTAEVSSGKAPRTTPRSTSTILVHSWSRNSRSCDTITMGTWARQAGGACVRATCVRTMQPSRSNATSSARLHALEVLLQPLDGLHVQVVRRLILRAQKNGAELSWCATHPHTTPVRGEQTRARTSSSRSGSCSRILPKPMRICQPPEKDATSRSLSRSGSKPSVGIILSTLPLSHANKPTSAHARVSTHVPPAACA
jgi:hypothetical protein